MALQSIPILAFELCSYLSNLIENIGYAEVTLVVKLELVWWLNSFELGL